MFTEASYMFLVVPFSIVMAMFVGSRHFMTFLMLLELLGVAIFICLSLYSPFEWVHLVSYVLVLGASEAAIGLAVMVKLSRSVGADRVSISSLLSVSTFNKW